MVTPCSSNYYLFLATQGNNKFIMKMIIWGLIILLFAVSNSSVIASKGIVKTLPGFPGELPFLLQTGYIRVNDSELFYYFIESQGDPKQDPLFLWLSGGPGCSSFNALIYGLGPVEFDINHYIGGVPKLAYYPYAWTKSASIIFLDSPVDNGFSYLRNAQGWVISDTTAADQAYLFLRKWLEENPTYLSNQLLIGGGSYSGLIVPLITKLVAQGNEAGLLPRLNLKGYLLVSPMASEFITNNSRIQFSHRMALISNNLYEKLRSRCNGNYADVDPSNAECLTAIAEYQMCIKDIQSGQIMEPNCEIVSPQHYGQKLLEENSQDHSLRIPELWCPSFKYALSNIWANDASVQEALHVQKGKVKEWIRCKKILSYIYDVESVLSVHQWLSKRNLRLLIVIGDRDMIIPFVSTDTWIRALNLTIVEEWRPWFVNDQVAGYRKKYTENGFHLTYATVKGGGHTADETNRRECYEMFQSWIHDFST